MQSYYDHTDDEIIDLYLNKAIRYEISGKTYEAARWLSLAIRIDSLRRNCPQYVASKQTTGIEPST